MTIVASTAGRVRILTIDRPEARNALDAGTRKDLIAKLKEAEQDPNLGAIVLTGAGSTFAAGADLKELVSRSSDEQLHFLQPPHIYSTLEGLAKPVVAAINGHALGAGLELATACDIRICAATAKLGQPEVTLGLIPGGGGTQRLAALVGAGQAARLVLTGDAVTAEEALRIGLVDLVVAQEDTVAKAVELAAAMARHDPAALAAAKRSLLAARGPGYATGLETEIEEFVRLHARPESKARIQAFLDRPAKEPKGPGKGPKAPSQGL
ncbi:MAG TPA: enoyl-CoA hydratase/isomerase family protein [Candidatus Thermoplasmatota archaeon]|nr:enoyl-CoA hydratase/isomerase family protein [Candidatus Thermoplasmatota archaeon]